MPLPHTPLEESYPINVTNMIDVFLLLLIFFLVATTFTKEERDASVQLPGTSAIRPLSAPPKDLVLNILQDGTIKINTQTYDTTALTSLLQKTAHDEPDRNVLIRADERSLMKYFATVARTCRDAGITQLKIGYVVESDNK